MARIPKPRFDPVWDTLKEFLQVEPLLEHYVTLGKGKGREADEEKGRIIIEPYDLSGMAHRAVSHAKTHAKTMGIYQEW